MAETVTALAEPLRLKGYLWIPPTKVYDANEHDLSTASRKVIIPAFYMEGLSMYLTFANYTSVTVKLQASLDGGTNWYDIPSSSLTATGTGLTVVNLVVPVIAVNVQATLSVGADTLGVWVYPHFKVPA